MIVTPPKAPFNAFDGSICPFIDQYSTLTKNVNEKLITGWQVRQIGSWSHYFNYFAIFTIGVCQ